MVSNTKAAEPNFTSFISQTGTITFQNHVYITNELSQDTLQWLKWYKTLPKESADTVSYIPSELQTKAKPKVMYSNPSINEATTMSTQNSISTFSLAPVSSGAPIYDPKYWNNPANINHANCYLYAMTVRCNSTSKKYMQPGYSAGKTFTSLTKASIIRTVKADCPYLGKGRSKQIRLLVSQTWSYQSQQC